MKKTFPILLVSLIVFSFSSCNRVEDDPVNKEISSPHLKSGQIYCNDGVFFSSYTNFTNLPDGFADAGWTLVRNNESVISLYMKPIYGFQDLPDNVDIGFYRNSLPASRPDPSTLYYHFTSGLIDPAVGFHIDVPSQSLYFQDLGTTAPLKCGETVYIVLHYDAMDASGNHFDIWTGNLAVDGTAGENYWFYKYINYTPDCCVTCSGETAWGGNSSGSGKAWWKYFQVSAGYTQNIIAGQNVVVGTLTYDPVSKTIDINLVDDWALDIKDLNSDGIPDDNTVKIQGYNVLPASRPTPGLFTTYKGNSLNDIYVGYYPYFAVHLDVVICK